MSTSRTIKLTARYAYEACMPNVPDAVGWNKEPREIKEGWYKAAKLWDAARIKTSRKILGKILRKPRAKQRS